MGKVAKSQNEYRLKECIPFKITERSLLEGAVPPSHWPSTIQKPYVSIGTRQTASFRLEAIPSN